MEKKIIYLANVRLPTEKAHGYQICKMCEAFSECGLDVQLIHPYRKQKNQVMEGTSTFEYYGIKPVFAITALPNLDVFQCERFVPQKMFKYLFFIHALLWSCFAAWMGKRQNADLYYTRDIPIACWLVRLGVPTVYEAHVVHHGVQQILLNRIANHPNLKRVITITSHIKDRLSKGGISKEKIIVLPDCVDLSLFENIPDKKTCRRQLGLPLDRHIVGYIGRFSTMDMQKGITELIEAVAMISSSKTFNPLLLCVGGPLNAVPAYMKHAKKKGLSEENIRFIDRVPNGEVPFWIHACDVVTIPWPWTEFSAYFTSPMKLFEYMASGVLIVATDLPALKEVLRHGENAWLVKPGDSAALSAGIEHILKNPATGKRIADQALEDVKDLTWIKRATKILEVLSGSC